MESIAIQTDSSLMTLSHMKKMNPQLYGHLPTVAGESKRVESTTTEEERILASVDYHRETSTLGGVKGVNCVSVATQCEIKIASKFVRDM